MHRRPYARRRTWALFVLLSATLPGLPRVARAASDGPTLTLAEPRTQTDEQWLWSSTLKISNQTDNGVYVDSARCVVENLDLGVTGNPKTYTVPMTGFKLLIPSLSAGESGDAMYQFPASADRARLTYHVFTHSAAGKSWELTASAEADPGELSKRMTSTMIQSGGHKVEVVFMPANGDSGVAAPGVLLVHGSGSHARLMFALADRLARRGYAVMLVSQPGFGTSDGPADFAGPATISALSAALDRFATIPGVDRTRIAAWGIDRGATAAALLALRRPDLRAVIAQCGFYDLQATYRGTSQPALKAAIVKEAGSDSAAWQARSPVALGGSVKATVFVLHGEQDQTAPAPQAHAYQAALARGGAKVESRFLPMAGHQIPQGELQRRTFEFLDRTLEH